MKDNGENHPENLIKLALVIILISWRRRSFLFYKSSLIPVKDKKFLYDLWEEHEQVRKDFSLNDEFTNLKNTMEASKPSFSYMDLKISIAKKLFDECIFCERRCGINRNDESRFCG